MSWNDRPLIVTSSASTSIREYPVNTTAPGCPVSDVSVSDLLTSRTALGYMPGLISIVSPSDAASIMPWIGCFGSPSITYAAGAQLGSTYTSPSDGSSAMPLIWLVPDATPILAWVSASRMMARGSVQSYSETYSRPRAASSTMSSMGLWAARRSSSGVRTSTIEGSTGWPDTLRPNATTVWFWYKANILPRGTSTCSDSTQTFGRHGQEL